MKKLLQNLPKYWYQKHPLLYAAYPLALLYQTVTFIRSNYYRRRSANLKFTVPIIVVGNISVGGTGKTPLVIALVQLLKAQGWQPGVVSRGFGGKATNYPQHVTADSKASAVGDEAILIAQRGQCPVVVDPKRVRAVQALLAQQLCDVVISDDGLQHYALPRDIEIAVIDGQRGFGNGLCLPAGPLRESRRRLKEVDFVICNGDRRGHIAQSEYPMELIAQRIYNIHNSQWLAQIEQLRRQPIHAIAAIGHPERFFHQLRKLGFTIIPHPFPDHHMFSPQDIDFAGTGEIIMTEKDAVKCRSFADDNCWVMPIKTKLSDEFCKAFFAKLPPRPEL